MVSTLVSLCFGSSRLGHTMKTNCMKLDTVESRDMLDFWFFEKAFGTSLSTTFVGDFTRIKCYILYWSNYWSNFIVWLPLLLEISGNICLVFVYYSVCDVVNFEINLSFFVKLFSYMTKKNKTKISRSIFHHFKRTFSCQKLSQAWECDFNPFWPNLENLWFPFLFRGYRNGALS